MRALRPLLRELRSAILTGIGAAVLATAILQFCGGM